jgi:hypothetical protein
LKLLINFSFGETYKAFYSYGDSSGFTPDSHFNPGHPGTNYGANVKASVLKAKSNFCEDIKKRLSQK